jgi:branched-chain amino acid transport system substrate-binding protein
VTRRLRATLTIVVATIVLLTTGCSSSSKSSSSSSTTSNGSSGTTTPSASGGGSPIAIGGVASIELDGVAGIAPGFEARIARFNKAGGLNGRMIKFVGVQDDGGSPATALATVQSLVERQHVFAVAPVTSGAFNGSQITFLAQNNTPVIGWGITPDWCGNQWAFPLTGCVDGPLNHEANLTSFSLYLSHTGKTPSQVRLAVVGDQSPASTSSTASQTKVFKQLGYDVVYSGGSAPATGGATDYTPYAQPILASNPTLVYSLTSFQNSVGIFGALRQEGYKGDILNNTGEIPGLFTSLPALAKTLDGVYSASEFPVTEEQTPVIQEIQADLTAIGQAPSVSLGDSIGWWSADLLIAGLQAAAAKGAVTPKTFEQAMNNNFTYNSTQAGGIEGLSFPQMNIQAGTLGCSSVVQVNNAAKVWEVTGKYTCQPPYPIPK